MHKNIEGLKRSVRAGRDGALARATAALQRREAGDQQINFRTVASEARVSSAWLYGHQELRKRIVSLGKLEGSTVPDSVIRDRQRQSRENIVATLRLRIKTLEEGNRELTELLERAYGVIALPLNGTRVL